jgi:cell wall-associated NlpC family hydrolase
MRIRLRDPVWGKPDRVRELIMDMRVRWVSFLFSVILVLTLLVGGCGRPAVRPGVPPLSPPAQSAEKKALPHLGYTIQAGAFADAENAARLTRSLQEKGLEATYFVARQGLYKVRFGNFSTREQAHTRAEEFRKSGIIEEFYVVSPGEYAVARRETRGEAYLREELVRSARSFLGVPYLWGGASAETGFDCSGLTMTVYQLNGLDLPRTSREQFGSGTPPLWKKETCFSLPPWETRFRMSASMPETDSSFTPREGGRKSARTRLRKNISAGSSSVRVRTCNRLLKNALLLHFPHPSSFNVPESTPHGSGFRGPCIQTFLNSLDQRPFQQTANRLKRRTSPLIRGRFFFQVAG